MRHFSRPPFDHEIRFQKYRLGPVLTSQGQVLSSYNQLSMFPNYNTFRLLAMLPSFNVILLQALS